MDRTSVPVVPELVDGFSRRINYLRLSLTDRCNFRCTYCMPDQGIVFRTRKELLSFEEIERILRVFVDLGVVRLRLTGGEPTVRARVVSLVQTLAKTKTPDGGRLEVVMTSNGHRLAELAKPLAAAGLRGLNVSLDTLDPARFSELTLRGDLSRVVAGIDAAIEAGLNVKLNTVAMKGVNDHELDALCEFAWDRGIAPRFIEHMPMSDGLIYSVDRQIPAAEIRARLSARYDAGLVPVDAGVANGPARYWRLNDDSNRQFGIISAMSEHFCDTCNRVRISAVGDLHACLGYDDATSLRDILRAGGSDDDLRAAIARTVSAKRVGHQFHVSGAGAPGQHMIAIGG